MNINDPMNLKLGLFQVHLHDIYLQHTFSATLCGFLIRAQGQKATPLWEMALLNSPLLWGERVCVGIHT